MSRIFRGTSRAPGIAGKSTNISHATASRYLIFCSPCFSSIWPALRQAIRLGLCTAACLRTHCRPTVCISFTLSVCRVMIALRSDTYTPCRIKEDSRVNRPSLCPVHSFVSLSPVPRLKTFFSSADTPTVCLCISGHVDVGRASRRSDESFCGTRDASLIPRHHVRSSASLDDYVSTPLAWN